jgi:hypothetical protein
MGVAQGAKAQNSFGAGNGLAEAMPLLHNPLHQALAQSLNECHFERIFLEANLIRSY